MHGHNKSILQNPNRGLCHAFTEASFDSTVETGWAPHPLNGEVYDQPKDLQEESTARLTWLDHPLAQLCEPGSVSVPRWEYRAVEHTRLVSGRLSDPQVGPEPIAVNDLPCVAVSAFRPGKR